jgi:hypothetical protein
MGAMRTSPANVRLMRTARPLITLAFALLWLTRSALAEPPNYTVNTQLPAYKLGDVAECVDVWGEGRLDYKIESDPHVSGFKDCYNVNLATQKVSVAFSPDTGKDLPNLIPVSSFTVGLDGKFKPKTVKIFTLMNAPLTKKMADDIADAVADGGRILLYGSNLTFQNRMYDALNEKGRLKDWTGYAVPTKLPDTYAARFKEIQSVDATMAFVIELVVK